MAKKKHENENENVELAEYLQSFAKEGDVGWEFSSTTDIVLSEVKYVITTGIAPFDGIAGGIPVGRLVELYGLESCGKTAMAIRCAARAMKRHVSEVCRDAEGKTVLKPVDPSKVNVTVVYIDNEGSLDDDNKLVVDGEKLNVVGGRVDTTDDVFKAIDKAMAHQRKVRLAKQDKDGILRIMLIVVDTIASTSTKQELEQAWGTPDFPRQPQQISKALRQLVRTVNRNQVAILFTNQVRVKYQAGAPAAKGRGRTTFTISADDYSSVGGMALRFYTSHRIFMYSFGQKYKLLPDAQFAGGLLVGFHTKKNRINVPLRDGRMVLLFDKKRGGLNNDFSVLETLVFLGFIEVGSESKHTDYTLKFKRNGIVPTTFDVDKIETTLEEDEEKPVLRRGSSRKDPGFKYRADWPQFYRDHKADVDKLWDAAMAYTDVTEGLDGGVCISEQDVSVTEDDD